MLIRAIFWFSLVVMLVPIKVDRPYSASHPSYSLQVTTLAKSFIGDVSGFCHRNPNSCASSRNMVSSLSIHMRHQMYQWVKVLGTGEKAYPVDNVLTGSIKST